MSETDRDLLLSYADRIRAELRAPELDVLAGIDAGDIQLLRDCEVSGTSINYVGSPIPAISMLFARVHDGAPIVIAISKRFHFKYVAYRERLEFLESQIGQIGIEPLIATLREQRTQSAFGRKKLANIHGCIERYGRLMVPRAYFGRHIWMQPADSAHLYWSVIDRTLQQELTSDTDAVIDIGCGDGSSMLVQLAIKKGRSDVAYFGCEISKPAIECLSMLAKISGLDNIHPVEFDLHASDFAFLKPYKRVLVISQGALVCGRNGCAAVWENLFASVPVVRACLFEPLSHAIPNLAEPPLITREQADNFGFDPEVFKVLLHLAESGRINITEVIPDITSMNPLAPASLIRFETTATVTRV